MNERQLKVLGRLLDGFEGKRTSSQWAAVAKCSPDTALRDITDLLARGVLRKTVGGGRSTGYELDEWMPKISNKIKLIYLLKLLLKN